MVRGRWLPCACINKRFVAAAPPRPTSPTPLLRPNEAIIDDHMMCQLARFLIQNIPANATDAQMMPVVTVCYPPMPCPMARLTDGVLVTEPSYSPPAGSAASIAGIMPFFILVPPCPLFKRTFTLPVLGLPCFLVLNLMCHTTRAC